MGRVLFILVGTLSLLCFMWPASTAPPDNLMVTLLIWKPGLSYLRTFTYETGSDTLRAVDVGFWNRTRMPFGDNDRVQPAYRFYGFKPNVLECREIAAFAKQLGVDSSQVKPIEMWCHQSRGLLDVTVSLFGSFPNYTESVQGYELRGPMSTSVLDIEAIYDDDRKDWIFVDSINIDPFARAKGEKRYCFGYGRFDQNGENYYYWKRDLVLRYNLASKVIDTLYGGNLPAIPFNSMDVLLLAEASKQLHLLDSAGNIAASVETDLEVIYDVGKVSDSVFVVSGWERTLWGNRRQALYLFDFGSGQRRLLIELPGIAEILDIGVISAESGD